MWTTPAATEMRFGFEVTMYVMNKQFEYISSGLCKKGAKCTLFYFLWREFNELNFYTYLITNSFGKNTQIFPVCFIAPALAPASLPSPQQKSARTPPLIAPPVSCAIIKRLSGLVLFGSVVDNNTAVGRQKNRWQFFIVKCQNIGIRLSIFQIQTS